MYSNYIHNINYCQGNNREKYFHVLLYCNYLNVSDLAEHNIYFRKHEDRIVMVFYLSTAHRKCILYLDTNVLFGSSTLFYPLSHHEFPRHLLYRSQTMVISCIIFIFHFNNTIQLRYFRSRKLMANILGCKSNKFSLT